MTSQGWPARFISSAFILALLVPKTAAASTPLHTTTETQTQNPRTLYTTTTTKTGTVRRRNC